MKVHSESKSARNTPQQQAQKQTTQNRKQRWGGGGEFEDELEKAMQLSLETASEKLANELGSEESGGGGADGQLRMLAQFKRQKVERDQRQKEQKEREERQKRQRESEAARRQKEKERERSREAQRSREQSKRRRRDILESNAAERRIANKVRDGLVDRALETIRDRRAAGAIAELNRNLSAALRPGLAYTAAPAGPIGPLGPFGVPKWPSSGHKGPKDDDDDDEEEEGAFAFNTACQSLSATGECDSRAMQRYPVSSVFWVHEAAPASAYGSMLSSIVEFWREKPSEKHESKTKRLYQKVFRRYADEGRSESPISIAAKVIGTCIYVWGSVSGTARWTVYHNETGECSLSSRAPVYIVMYGTSTPGKYRYARIKPHTK